MSQIGKRRELAAASADENPQYRERLELIRRSAGTVFHEKGFAATKLSDVAERAGMDRASLYYYVESKEQLFRDIVTEAVTHNIASAREVAALESPARDKLYHVIRQLMMSFETHYPFMYVLVQEDVDKLRSPSEEDGWLTTVSKWTSEYFHLVKGIISEGLADGSIESMLPPGVIANCVISMLNGSNGWFRPGGVLDADEIGDGMARLVLRGLEPRRE